MNVYLIGSMNSITCILTNGKACLIKVTRVKRVWVQRASLCRYDGNMRSFLKIVLNQMYFATEDKNTLKSHSNRSDEGG